MTSIISPDELDAWLPKLLKYRPSDGSIVVVDTRVSPVATLRPALMDYWIQNGDSGLKSMLNDLRVFEGRRVIFYSVGDVSEPHYRVVKRALQLYGVHIYDRTLATTSSESLFKGLPSRNEYMSDPWNEATSKAASWLADQIADGAMSRPNE